MLYVVADFDDSNAFLDVVTDIAAESHGRSIDVWALIDQNSAASVPLLGQLAWSDARMFRIRGGKLHPVPLELPAIKGESDMGDPVVLTRFMRAALSASRTPFTCLWFLGHGAGADGVCQDQNTGAPAPSSGLSASDLQEALGAGLKGLRRRLDLMVASSCHSGSLETLIGVAPWCGHLVASEAYTCMYKGIDARAAVARMDVRPPGSAQDIARHIVASYEMKEVCGCGVPAMGQSIQYYDLCSLRAVLRAADSLYSILVRRLADQPGATRQLVLAARAQAAPVRCALGEPTLSCKADGASCCHRDLTAFLEGLQNSPDPAVVSGATSTLARLRQLVRAQAVCLAGDSRVDALHGLSVYLPCQANAIDGQHHLIGAAGAAWAEFLHRVFPSGCKLSKPPRVEVRRTAPSHGGAVALKATAREGELRIARAWLRVRTATAAGPRTAVLDVPLDSVSDSISKELVAEWDGHWLEAVGSPGPWPLLRLQRERGARPALWGTTPVLRIRRGGGDSLRATEMVAHVRFDPPGNRGRIVVLRPDPSVSPVQYALDPSEAGVIALFVPPEPAAAADVAGTPADKVQLGWVPSALPPTVRLSFLVEDREGDVFEFNEP